MYKNAYNFVGGISQFIKAQRSGWAVLDFSELGFIGKLFRSKDLEKLARFMLTFYDEQPVDWLLRLFRKSMAQGEVLLRKPTLFQHRGLKSSFPQIKDNTLKDKYFDEGDKPVHKDSPPPVDSLASANPPAVITTKVRHYGQYSPDKAYSGLGYFWAIDLIKRT